MDPFTSYALGIGGFILAAAAIAVPVVLRKRDQANKSGTSMPGTPLTAPHIELDWDRTKVQGFMPIEPGVNVPWVAVYLTNYGNSPAKDLQVWADTAMRADGNPWDEVLSLPITEPRMIVVPMWKVEQQEGKPYRVLSDLFHYPTVTVSWRNEMGSGRMERQWQITGTGY